MKALRNLGKKMKQNNKYAANKDQPFLKQKENWEDEGEKNTNSEVPTRKEQARKIMENANTRDSSNVEPFGWQQKDFTRNRRRRLHK